MRIAIIGSGVSGLGAAYLLHKKHEIVVYERTAKPGGHSCTIDIKHDGANIPVDIGVNVFSSTYYVNLMKVFKRLSVPLQMCDMSFAASFDKGQTYEWSTERRFGASFKNAFNKVSYNIILDAISFYFHVSCFSTDPTITLGKLLEKLRLGQPFRDYCLLPMASAIYTCPPDVVLNIPARTFANFCKLHGLLSIFRRPAWHNIPGGVREYVSRLSAPFADSIRLNCAIQSVSRSEGRVKIIDSRQNTETFDAVVFACHPDDVLAAMTDVTLEEKNALRAFKYYRNELYVHTDPSVMPHDRTCWSSWNYALRTHDNRSEITYWVNKLQSRFDIAPLFITINPIDPPAEKYTLHKHTFSHPIFDLSAVAAQSEMRRIQGKSHTWYCGAYLKYGFHEDGFSSAIETATLVDTSVSL